MNLNSQTYGVSNINKNSLGLKQSSNNIKVDSNPYVNTFQDYEEIDYSNPPSDYTDDNIIFMKNERDKRGTVSPFENFVKYIGAYRLNSSKPTPILYLGLDTSYTPQGYCSGEYGAFVTSYKKDKKPKVKYVSNDGTEKEFELYMPFGTHVGGISVSGDKVYITSKGDRVYVFNLDDFVNKDTSSTIMPSAAFKTGLDANSFLTVYKDEIYVGHFNEQKDDIVKKFKITESGDIVDTGVTMKIPSKIQGMTIQEVDGKKYLVLSQSFGRNNESSVYIHDFDESRTDYSSNENTRIIMPSMLEQIQLNSDGTLDCLFESCAKKYSDASQRADSVYRININGDLN